MMMTDTVSMQISRTREICIDTVSIFGVPRSRPLNISYNCMSWTSMASVCTLELYRTVIVYLRQRCQIPSLFCGFTELYRSNPK